jgi:hypothetical protein
MLGFDDLDGEWQAEARPIRLAGCEEGQGICLRLGGHSTASILDDDRDAAFLNVRPNRDWFS